MRSWLWPVIFKNSLFFKWLKTLRVKLQYQIYSTQALIPASVKTFHTFSWKKKERKSVKPTKPTAAFTDQIGTLTLNIAIMLYFFPKDINISNCKNETYRLCCVEKYKDHWTLNVQLILQCTFQNDINWHAGWQNVKSLISVQYIISGYYTPQWCKQEIKATKFEM